MGEMKNKKPSKPNKFIKKTMKMSTISNKNRTGIYVQKSAGVTTAGDGFSPPKRRDKSPVTKKLKSTFKSDDEDTSNYPHTSGQSQTYKYTKTQIPRKRPWKPTPKHQYGDGTSMSMREHYFESPAIKAGVTEFDSTLSREYKLRNRQKFEDTLERQYANRYIDARRLMGLKGNHIERRSRSPSPPKKLSRQDCEEFLDLHPETKVSRKNRKMRNKVTKSINLSILDEKYPIEATLINKSHAFLGVEKLQQPVLLAAVETIVQDERCTYGRTEIKIGPCEYKRNILTIRCKNEETFKLLSDNIPLFNRLWLGADFDLTKERIFVKRHKIGVKLPNYAITSDEFFKIIGKQNNFPTKSWSLIHKTEDFNGFKALLGVDPESYKRMEESNGYVYFCFEKMRVQLEGWKK